MSNKLLDARYELAAEILHQNLKLPGALRKTFECPRRSPVWLILLLLFPFITTAQPDAILAELDNPTGLTAERAIRELQQYAPAEFDVGARAYLADILLQEQFPHQDKYFLLAGYLGMADALRNVPVELRQTGKMKRAYGLALVRAGDLTKTRELIQSVRAFAYDDDFVYELAPLLIYTHEREIYDLLIEHLLTAANNCNPADPHADGRLDCGYRLMELLAPVLVGYPYKVGISGDLETSDYRKALVEIRSWLRRHQSDYEIVADTY